MTEAESATQYWLRMDAYASLFTNLVIAVVGLWVGVVVFRSIKRDAKNLKTLQNEMAAMRKAAGQAYKNDAKNVEFRTR